MIVDETFFVGEINIPNTSKPEIKNSLTIFIEKYESELLTDLLGKELFNLVEDARGDDRIYVLILGTDKYTVDGLVGSWRGLNYSYGSGVTGQTYSLIAYYIYWWWMKDKQIWGSGVGTSRVKPQNAEVMPIYMKLITAWNKFSEETLELYNFLSANQSIYPEWCSNSIWAYTKINDFDI
jgi:hypothetical protein